jgi:DNA-binding MarR family transcriptional regulator
MTGAAEPEPVTQLVDHVFALSGLLAQEGDRLTAPYALTAARWLVLGALQDGPSSAAEIARRRGLQRQSVRESVQRLLRTGHIEQVSKVNSRTIRVGLTAAGRAALDQIEPRRAAWAAELGMVLPAAEVAAAVDALARLREWLDPPRTSAAPVAPHGARAGATMSR